MNTVIHSAEPLVFRDGRPFGDFGHVNGGMLCWPWPSTVCGMLRNRIGLSRDDNYFRTDNGEKIPAEKIAAMKRITAGRTIPLWQENGNADEWQYLFPAPADALIVNSSQENSYNVHGFGYEDPFAKGGIDLPWQNWKIPIAQTLEKPAGDAPELWCQSAYFSWLKNGKIAKEISAKELGLSLPQPEIRFHTAIDSLTGTVKTGQLFSSQGIRLATADTERQKAGRFGIGTELDNTDSKDSPFGPCYFGAERKIAFVDKLHQQFPKCPDWFEKVQNLRLILISPGDFGSWAPSWLLPDSKDSETNWCKVPGSDISIRLCSAFVPRWQPVSGWDYEHRRPKATRKLVPAGAVYVIELQDAARSQEFAEIVWGCSIGDDLTDPDGCGAVCVGNVKF